MPKNSNIDALRNFANPYDFANPVTDEKFFFGRSSEIADLTYYLDHTQKTNRAIHIAFVGARASGKTSFLNMAAREADRRKFCTVRINLDEGDVADDFSFFRKLFHSIANVTFQAGGFGGKNSNSYFAYLDLIAGIQPAEKQDIPFIFPMVLFRNSPSGAQHIPDDIFSEDLEKISKELNRPILLLFDECNVLQKNRVVLEKLRNIFMNMEGFMLIFAATEDFFSRHG